MNLDEKVNKIKNDSKLSVGNKLDKISMLYVEKGYTIGYKTENQLQMIRKKSFSFLWAFLWFLLWGLGLIVYLLYYFSKKDEIYTITLPKEESTKNSQSSLLNENSL